MALISLLQSYPELLLCLISLILLVLYYYFFFFSNPNPRLPARLPLAGHTPYIFLHFHHLHDWFTDILRLSGCSFVFYGPTGALVDVVLTCDPANVNHVFNANFLNYPKGDDFAELFDFLGSGIFTSDKESWKFQRKKAHSLMSTPSFRSFVLTSTRHKIDNSLVPFLDHFASSNETLDLQEAFLRLSFDNTCMLVFGADTGCLSVDLPTVPFAKAMDDAEEAVFFRQIVPLTWWKILRFLRIGPEKKMAEAVSVMDSFITDYITKRRQEKRAGRDLLASYLDCHQEIADSHGLPHVDKFLKDTVLNLMVAGRDTVSSALTWFFYMLTRNPSVEEKILDEVRVWGSDDLGKLVYLHACLCESLRLYPPVPFEHKGAIKPDVLPSGIRVHQHRRVLVSLYAMARMEAVWGEDCAEFRPERWLTDGRKVRHEPSYKFLSFNAGPRTCLGKEIAFTQMKAVAAAVVGKFRVRVEDERKVVRPKMSIILHMEGGFMVRVTKREE